MQDVHILKDVAYLAKQGGGSVTINDLHLLAPGAFAVVCEGTLVTTLTVEADLAGKKTFDLYVGTNNGSVTKAAQYPRTSLGINRYPKLFATKAYAAGTARVVDVGYNGSSGSLGLPGTLIPGEICTMKIIRRNIANDNYPLSTREDQLNNFVDALRINYTIKATDNLAAVVTALVNAVNNHPQNQGVDKWITAAGISGQGVGLTASSKYQDFDVVTDDAIIDATITVDTAQVFPVGTWQQVRELEQNAVTRFGDSNRTHLREHYFDVASQVDTAVNYEQIVIAYDTPQTVALAANAGPINNELILALPTAATNRADYLTVLNTVILQGTIA